MNRLVLSDVYIHEFIICIDSKKKTVLQKIQWYKYGKLSRGLLNKRNE